MPLRHTPKGWYWGSQGPFKTKAKAQAVANAAYANGYEGKEQVVYLTSSGTPSLYKR